MGFTSQKKKERRDKRELREGNSHLYHLFYSELSLSLSLEKVACAVLVLFGL